MSNRLSPLLFEKNCVRQPHGPTLTMLALAKGCWLWRPDALHAIVRIDGERWPAVRASYVTHIGKLAPGWDARSLCGNRRCCEPTHLHAVRLAKPGWQEMVATATRTSKLAHERPRVRKLLATDVQRVLLGGEPAKDVAAALGIGVSYVSKLRSGKAKAAVLTDIPRHAARRYSTGGW